MIERVRSTANGRHSAPLSRSDLFGPAPILPGEDAAAYDELLMLVSSSLKPSDVIEEFWLRDVVDLAWQIIRKRRAKECLVASRLEYLLNSKLKSLEDLNQDQIDAIIKAFRAGKPSAMQDVETLLAIANSTLNALLGRAFCDQLDQIEHLDRLITIDEARRNAALRELERHRASFAQTLRKKIDELDGVESKAAALAAKPVAIKGPR